MNREGPVGPHGTHMRAPSWVLPPTHSQPRGHLQEGHGLAHVEPPRLVARLVCVSHRDTADPRRCPDGDPPTKLVCISQRMVRPQDFPLLETHPQVCISQGTVRPQDFPHPPARQSPFSHLLLHSSEIITKVNSQHRAQALISGDREQKCSGFLGTALSAP